MQKKKKKKVESAIPEVLYYLRYLFSFWRNWNLWAAEKYSHLVFTFILHFVLQILQIDIKGRKVDVDTENTNLFAVFWYSKTREIFS